MFGSTYFSERKYRTGSPLNVLDIFLVGGLCNCWVYYIVTGVWAGQPEN